MTERLRESRLWRAPTQSEKPGQDHSRPGPGIRAGCNQDHGGAGLGLAIARDIARSHGGDVTLGKSAMGGLRATVRLPV